MKKVAANDFNCLAWVRVDNPANDGYRFRGDTLLCLFRTDSPLQVCNRTLIARHVLSPDQSTVAVPMHH